MRIAPSFSTTSPHSNAPTVQAAQLAPTSAPAAASSKPPFLAYQKYGTDLLAIPGVRSISWSNMVDDELRLTVPDAAAASVVVGLLRPKVDDVKLVVILADTRQPYTGPATTSTQDRVRAVAAMNGVWRYSFSGMSATTNGAVLYQTVDQKTIDRLKPLIVDRFDAGVFDDGRPRFVSINWRAGVPSV